jgi:uncharacterized protein with HEPN domain
LCRIVEYCQDIEESVLKFGNSFEDFMSNKQYRDVCAFYIGHIGELVGELSFDIVSEYDAVPWEKVRGMRNRIFHDYDRVKNEVVWGTIAGDISILKQYCEKIISDLDDRMRRE